MTDEPKPLQVNVNFDKDPELLKDLDRMVKDDDTDRSKFIRRLIRQEAASRQQLPLFPVAKNQKSRAVAA
ncbi:MAG TPA: hypothetical protein DCS05_08060 [Nitrospiraceae bacterium]|nr:hypothetical protein [Nitrospiraceae bacterium]